MNFPNDYTSYVNETTLMLQFPQRSNFVVINDNGRHNRFELFNGVIIFRG